MEGMEDGVTRPRQVRYQAALRPDCLHSTLLPSLATGVDHGVLIQRTCFCREIPQDCVKTTANGINILHWHFVRAQRVRSGGWRAATPTLIVGFATMVQAALSECPTNRGVGRRSIHTTTSGTGFDRVGGAPKCAHAGCPLSRKKFEVPESAGCILHPAEQAKRIFSARSRQRGLS